MWSRTVAKAKNETAANGTLDNLADRLEALAAEAEGLGGTGVLLGQVQGGPEPEGAPRRRRPVPAAGPARRRGAAGALPGRRRAGPRDGDAAQRQRPGADRRRPGTAGVPDSRRA